MSFDFMTFSTREGLFIPHEDGLSCSLPGSAISVRFEGTEISAALKDLSGGGKIWVNAWIDDLPCRSFRIDPENEVYQIADDLPSGSHTLTLQKRTEAVFGTLLLQNFTTNGSFLPPPEKQRDRLLLLIGDSITCGFGNEAQIPSDVDASTENFALTYGFLAARDWNADVLACAASGTGIFQNFAGGKEGRMSDFFMETFCAQVDNLAVDRLPPDAAVINLGTNDWSAPIDPSDYIRRYEELLDFFRLRYPSIPLICAIGSMNHGPAPFIEEMVKNRRASGDTQLHFLLFPLIDRKKDGFGGAGHPSLRKNREMADLLAKTLRGIQA